jgi:ligand-binding SRPBCC domain-containing protein
MHTFRRLTKLAAPREAVFAWHDRAGAFHQLTPPWVQMEVLRHDGIADGAQVVVRLWAPKLPVAIRWELQHADYIKNEQFVDRQISGPFRSWEHTHRFIEDPAGCTIEDSISFDLPAPVPFVAELIKAELKRLFDFRAEVLTTEFGVQK